MINKREKGITLVALIITIIILIILAAISIKAISDMDIISLATEGTIKFAEKQNEEMQEFDYIDNLINDTVNRIIQNGGKVEEKIV